MKLLYCPICGDIRKLTNRKRLCGCKASWGHYNTDGLNAIIGGKTVPLGIDNMSFFDALEHRPHEGLGAVFTAFIIPHDCEHITVTEDKSETR